MCTGVDTGGMVVKVGIVTSSGSIVSRKQEKYDPDHHEPQDVVDRAVLVLHNVL
uniref:Carbohydrate kinase FGGY N-terminal domain-containing protein n=1 Tax=Peronospora matthiolae TaxID=2874970 RepID=A0AAV1VMB5_9STRA